MDATRLLGRIRDRLRRGSLKQSRTRTGVKYADPLHAGRHPFQTYMMSVAVVSSLPLLFGITSARSVAYSLPTWLALAWGAALLGGAGMSLVGSYWLGGYADALTIERIGLYAVGAAAFVYGPTIFFFAAASTTVDLTDWQSVVRSMMSVLVPAGLTIGFGLSALRRARDIGLVIRSAIDSLNGHT